MPKVNSRAGRALHPHQPRWFDHDIGVRSVWRVSGRECQFERRRQPDRTLL